MTPRVMWVDVPADLRKTFQPYLYQHIGLLPSWVTEVSVGWENDAEGSLATNISHDYRRGSLYLRPGWFENDEERRQTTVIHELSHFALDPLHDCIFAIVTEFTRDDERLRRVLREQIRRALEQSTCDVTEMVSKALTVDTAGGGGLWMEARE